MKTRLNHLIVLFLMFFLFTSGNVFAQLQRISITVLNFDAQGINLTPQQLGNLARIEIERLDTFEVMDRYDVAYMIDKHKLNIDNCYGKICLVETGNIIGADKMLTGSAEVYGETLILSLRLIDVNSEKIEKNLVREFLNYPQEIQMMVRIGVNELFDRPNDPTVIQRLTKPSDYENPINNPNKSRISLGGPRMGATIFTGKTATYLNEPTSQGGYNAFPVMFQFGYQFEMQYLNQGDFQALFEFIPNVTGLDQNLIIPSITFLNGLRNTKNGFEIAFGPTVYMQSIAKGVYLNDVWTLTKGLTPEQMEGLSVTERLDSRGNYKLGTGFLFGIGRTFRSGKLNIPVNAYVIPNKSGARFGISFGYNAKRD